MKIRPLTRRNFIKSIGFFLTAIVILLWREVVNNIVARRKKKKIYLPDHPSNDITILTDIIIIKERNRLVVYSSKCTHLGCKINNQKNDVLICPCHGSRFNEDGVPVNGPAVKSLEKLTIYKDMKNGKQFVNVS